MPSRTAHPVRITDWTEQAVCRNSEVDFHPASNSPRHIKDPTDLCRSCPVREACLEFALDNDERHGIWGGLTPRQRRRMARDRAGQVAGQDPGAASEGVGGGAKVVPIARATRPWYEDQLREQISLRRRAGLATSDAVAFRHGATR